MSNRPYFIHLQDLQNRTVSHTSASSMKAFAWLRSSDSLNWFKRAFRLFDISTCFYKIFIEIIVMRICCSKRQVSSVAFLWNKKVPVWIFWHTNYDSPQLRHRPHQDRFSASLEKQVGRGNWLPWDRLDIRDRQDRYARQDAKEIYYQKAYLSFPFEGHETVALFGTCLFSFLALKIGRKGKKKNTLQNFKFSSSPYMWEIHLIGNKDICIVT